MKTFQEWMNEAGNPNPVFMRQTVVKVTDTGYLVWEGLKFRPARDEEIPYMPHEEGMWKLNTDYNWEPTDKTPQTSYL